MTIVLWSKVVVWVFFEVCQVYWFGQLLHVLQSKVRGRVEWLFPVLTVVVEVVLQKKLRLRLGCPSSEFSFLVQLGDYPQEQGDRCQKSLDRLCNIPVLGLSGKFKLISSMSGPWYWGLIGRSLIRWTICVQSIVLIVLWGFPTLSVCVDITFNWIVKSGNFIRFSLG